MEKMICTSCCAPLTPNTTKAFLTCAYCGTTVANPHYSQDAAEAAAASAKPDVAAAALSALREMGQSQNLTSIDADCFGDPIHGASQARIALSIPDGEQMYFLYDHTFLFVAFSDGLALTDTGLYYHCDSGEGKLSWETFITGAISCTDEDDGVDGELRIGSGIVLAVKSEKESRLARFLVDFHNHVYHQVTGEAAPASWCVTEPVSASASPAAAPGGGSSLLNTVLGLGGALGAVSAATRTASNPLKSITQRTASVHAAAHPTRRQDRRDHVAPPQPLHAQPHHRPSGPAAPARPGQPKSVRSVMPARPAKPAASARPGQAKSVRDVMPSRSGTANAMRDFRDSRDNHARGPQNQRKPGGRR